MKHSKEMKNASTKGSTEAIDEGRNETTRIPYTDSISAPSGEKKHKKNKRK